jgi:uncharacterized membrane protein (UPF0182 family)
VWPPWTRQPLERIVAISPDKETPKTNGAGTPAKEATSKVKKKSGPDRLQRLLRIKPGPLRRLILAAVVVLVVYALGSLISRLMTDYLWYQEVGHTTVFTTPIVARILVGLFFAVIFFVLFYGSLWLARKLSPRLRPASDSPDGNVLELITRRRWPSRLLLLASIVIAVIVGLSYSGRWQAVLLFLNRQDFGYADPLFGKDASFYVFTLPVWSMLVNFVGVTVLLTTIATAFTYVADRALVLTEKNRITFAPHVKAHLSAILSLAMLAKAGDYMLQTWELDFSVRGVTFGASYTDVHATLPVLRFLAIVSLLAAVLFLVNIRFRGWRLPVVAIGLMFLTWAFAGKLYPYIVQQYRVTPNEVVKESEYIASNIEATRWAYGVDKISEVTIQASEDLTAADLETNAPTIDNVRLWEPRPALSTYSQIQELGPYYSFTDVDVDRYTIDGKYRQVILSTRELDQSRLPSQSQSWVNKHLTYTHGCGFVLSPANETSSKGLPALFVSNIPPVTSTDLKITRPEIYYGELGNDFVVVRTENQEFDYPKGDSGVYATYAGDGGIPVGSKARQLAFAFRFNSMKLLFSGSLTADSRIMFRRTIQERVQAVAPFLTCDKDPYLVVRDDGSLVWMWDAYATTNRFPYSQPRADGTNYIRNSVKVVINTYDGGITLYQMDPDDALTNTWGKVYKGLLTPGDQMPADLRAHMRYPEDLYSMQAEVLSTYHMQDIKMFYNNEGAWQIPKELYGTEEVPVVPYYELLTLPGETKAEFALMLPFAQLNKTNMTALLVARMDEDHYGELVAINFPRDKFVDGPAQVESQISNDPIISPQLTLWGQSGSTVIRGNLLVVPVNQSVMYFEPVYLESETTKIPELARVIVVYGEHAVMEPTLKEALAKIFGESAGPGTTATTSGGTTTTVPGGTTTTTPSTTSTTVPGGTTTTTISGGPTTTLPTDPAKLATLADQTLKAALDAQRRGDWAEYGRLIDEATRIMEALVATY